MWLGLCGLTYLSEEPEDLAWPEDGQDVEVERVGMGRVVAGKEAHVCSRNLQFIINYYNPINQLKIIVKV